MPCNCKARILTSGVLVSLLVSALAGVRPLAAADRTVWEIGKLDQSSLEFKGHGDLFNPQYNPVFTVGKSDSDRWRLSFPRASSRRERTSWS